MSSREVAMRKAETTNRDAVELAFWLALRMDRVSKSERQRPGVRPQAGVAP